MIDYLSQAWETALDWIMGQSLVDVGIVAGGVVVFLLWAIVATVLERRRKKRQKQWGPKEKRLLQDLCESNQCGPMVPLPQRLENWPGEAGLHAVERLAGETIGRIAELAKHHSDAVRAIAAEHAKANLELGRLQANAWEAVALKLGGASCDYSTELGKIADIVGAAKGG